MECKTHLLIGYRERGEGQAEGVRRTLESFFRTKIKRTGSFGRASRVK